MRAARATRQPAPAPRPFAPAQPPAPSSPETLRYQRPELPLLDDIARYYALSEEAHWYSNFGPCHERLAARLASYVGEVHAVPVGNCTLGLMAALRTICGDPARPRSLIAVPSFTFTASACAIRWAGFEPLFVDVEESSWQLDPDALRAALERHDGEVAGVLACSTFGSVPPSAVRAGWREACNTSGVPLIVDSAAAFGAVGADTGLAGGYGDTEVFSFHATKPFAIGEGGAILTPDAELAERLTQIINFGIDPASRTSCVAGMNAKLPELLAAAGLAMLDHYDTVLSRRRRTAAKLQARIARHDVAYQHGSAGSTWQVFQLMLPDAGLRRRAIALAGEQRIEARTCFDPPLHRHPAFATAPRADGLSVTEALAARALSLPMANSLGPRQIGRIGHLIDATFEERPC